MARVTTVVAACLAPLLQLLTVAAVCCDAADCVARANVTRLDLRADRMTTSNHADPVAQLVRAGGGASPSFEPVEATCARPVAGTWTCTAALDGSVVMAALDVNCEGCDYDGDPMVLNGSCSLRYALELRDSGDGCALENRWALGVFGAFVVGAMAGMVLTTAYFARRQTAPARGTAAGSVRTENTTVCTPGADDATYALFDASPVLPGRVDDVDDNDDDDDYRVLGGF